MDRLTFRRPVEWSRPCARAAPWPVHSRPERSRDVRQQRMELEASSIDTPGSGRPEPGLSASQTVKVPLLFGTPGMRQRKILSTSDSSKDRDLQLVNHHGWIHDFAVPSYRSCLW